MSASAGSRERPMNVAELLAAATRFVAERGSDSARLDVELLLAEVLGLDRLGLYLRHDRPLSAAEREAFRELVRRRIEGEPVAYILGRKEFYGLQFEVSPAVLVPRPETELLVDCALQELRNRADAPLRLADVGVGSGAVAVTLALKLESATLVATDISAAALELAQRNAERHGVAQRLELREADLLSGVDGLFDAVVSNPPYLSEDELTGLARDVREHEPRAALVAGPSGLELIERLAGQAAERLCSGGVLCIEIGTAQLERATQLIEAQANLRFERAERDLAGHPRVIVARRKES